MSRQQVDHQLLGRLKCFAEGTGSASAKSTLRSWVMQMEAGDPTAVSASNLDALIRAITRLSLARSFYGLDHSDDGFRLDLITTQKGAMVEALKLEMEITEALVADLGDRRRLSASRADVSARVLSELENAFVNAFRD